MRYNDGVDELYAFFSLLTAKSYEEMNTVINGFKEAKVFMDKMYDLSDDSEFLGVYSVEEDMRKTMNSMKSLGRKEKEKENAINLYKNGVSVEVITKSLNISKEQLEEYLKENKE